MDSSKVGIGEVLAQQKSQGECPIFFPSQKLTLLEKKHVVMEKEALALSWTKEAFCYYMWGQKFEVTTDHAPLQWLFWRKDITP